MLINILILNAYLNTWLIVALWIWMYRIKINLYFFNYINFFRVTKMVLPLNKQNSGIKELRGLLRELGVR